MTRTYTIWGGDILDGCLKDAAPTSMVLLLDGGVTPLIAVRTEFLAGFAKEDTFHLVGEALSPEWGAPGAAGSRVEGKIEWTVDYTATENGWKFRRLVGATREVAMQQVKYAVERRDRTRTVEVEVIWP